MFLGWLMSSLFIELSTLKIITLFNTLLKLIIINKVTELKNYKAALRDNETPEQ